MRKLGEEVTRKFWMALCCLLLIGNLWTLARVSELKAELNPTFEQVKEELWLTSYELQNRSDISVAMSTVKYWENEAQAFSNAKTFQMYEGEEILFSCSILGGERSNCYMELWKVNSRGYWEDWNRKSKEKLQMEKPCTVMQVKFYATLKEEGTYIACVNDRGIDLYFAFELEKKE